MAQWVDVTDQYTAAKYFAPLEYYQCHVDATRPPAGPGIRFSPGASAMHFHCASVPQNMLVFYSNPCTIEYTSSRLLTLTGGLWKLPSDGALLTVTGVAGDAIWPPASVTGTPSDGDTTYDGTECPILLPDPASPTYDAFTGVRITYQETTATGTDPQFVFYDAAPINQSDVCSNSPTVDQQSASLLSTPSVDLVTELTLSNPRTTLPGLVAYADDAGVDFASHPALGVKRMWLPIRKIEVFTNPPPAPGDFWTDFVQAQEH